MAATFKKGDSVWLVGNWDSKGCFYFQRLTIQSWGSKTGTATKIVDGKMLKSRIYTDQVNNKHYGDHYFLDTPAFDVKSKALELAATYIAQELEDNKALIGNPSRYQPSIIAKIEHFSKTTPSVIDRDR